MGREEFRGVFAATTVPYVFDERAPAGLRVDLDRYEQHCEWLVRSGCAGLVVNTSMGECSSLTDDERRAVTRTAVRAAGSRARVVAAVYDTGSHQVVTRTRHAAQDGADAVLCLPPLAYEPTFSEVMRHFEAVASVGLPVLAGNNPSVCQVDLTPSMLAEISALPNVAAVCDFSDQVDRVWQVLEQAPDAAVFAGTDGVVVEGVLSGARAWIAALPNVFPRQTVRLFDLIESGRLVEAQRLRLALDGPLGWKASSGAVQRIKFGMDYLGRYGGPCRPPRQTLAFDVLSQAHREMRDVRKVLEPERRTDSLRNVPRFP